jgi:monovalent cation:H+ antiporter-2, CPA2 family
MVAITLACFLLILVGSVPCILDSVLCTCSNSLHVTYHYSCLQAARKAGFNVVYGDGTRAAVLRAAGVKKPRALAVCLTSNKLAAHKAVESLRVSYPTVPLYALGADIRDAAELERAGADRVVMSSTALGLRLGKEILQRLGASVSEANQVRS